jgi:ribulose kinase
MYSSLGIDYGTNSVRAVIVDCSNGAELGRSVVDYPSGHQGVLLDRNHRLQPSLRARRRRFSRRHCRCLQGFSDSPGGHDFPQGHRLHPNPENQKTYNELYRLYRAMHDAFGGVNTSPDLSRVMKDLIAINRDRASEKPYHSSLP